MCYHPSNKRYTDQQKRLSGGSKEGPSVHIHIHASVITWEPDVKRFISGSLNSICQFRIKEHVINARFAPRVRIEVSVRDVMLLVHYILEATFTAKFGETRVSFAQDVIKVPSSPARWQD